MFPLDLWSCKNQAKPCFWHLSKILLICWFNVAWWLHMDGKYESTLRGLLVPVFVPLVKFLSRIEKSRHKRNVKQVKIDLGISVEDLTKSKGEHFCIWMSILKLSLFSVNHVNLFLKFSKKWNQIQHLQTLKAISCFVETTIIGKIDAAVRPFFRNQFQLAAPMSSAGCQTYR